MGRLNLQIRGNGQNWILEISESETRLVNYVLAQRKKKNKILF